jgi:F-type H+-transporting ATPase subunit alpha
VLATLRETNVLDDDTTAEMEKAIDAFALEFQAGDGQGIGDPGSEDVDSLEAENVGQEKIVKGRR